MDCAMLRLTLFLAVCVCSVAAGVVTVPLTKAQASSSLGASKTTIPLIDFLDAQVRR
jgi:hypothetical protein